MANFGNTARAIGMAAILSGISGCKTEQPQIKNQPEAITQNIQLIKEAVDNETLQPEVSRGIKRKNRGTEKHNTQNKSEVQKAYNIDKYAKYFDKSAGFTVKDGSLYFKGILLNGNFTSFLKEQEKQKGSTQEKIYYYKWYIITLYDKFKIAITEEAEHNTKYENIINTDGLIDDIFWSCIQYVEINQQKTMEEHMQKMMESIDKTSITTGGNTF